MQRTWDRQSGTCLQLPALPLQHGVSKPQSAYRAQQTISCNKRKVVVELAGDLVVLLEPPVLAVDRVLFGPPFLQFLPSLLPHLGFFESVSQRDRGENSGADAPYHRYCNVHENQSSGRPESVGVQRGNILLEPIPEVLLLVNGARDGCRQPFFEVDDVRRMVVETRELVAVAIYAGVKRHALRGDCGR